MRAVFQDSENPPKRARLPVAMTALVVQKTRFPMRQVCVRLPGEFPPFSQCSVMSKQMEKLCEGTIEINPVMLSGRSESSFVHFIIILNDVLATESHTGFMFLIPCIL